ncbi:MAG: TlpA family protein disulfide reductase [Planctomycetaceae bacterium]|nr:TlpA family protein disulfide reductase [Planctomycetaceae bacterium]
MSLCAWFAVQTVAVSQPPKDVEPSSNDLIVHVIDSLSRPVAGARVGFSASFGDNSYESPSWVFLPDPATQERFPTEVVSDKYGSATFRDGKAILQKHRIGLIARHEERRLVGISNLNRSGDDNITMKVHPECVITGKMECLELQRKGMAPERNWLNVSANGQLFVEHYSNATEFEFFLPPGQYTLLARGADGGTLAAQRTLVVPEGVAAMELSPLQLSLKPSRDIAGQPAPELVDVIAWKGDGPRSLADLKGKVVLLDFWGYWCQACITKMPRLIELNNRYREHGLTILGLHIDAGNRITSLAEYDTLVKRLKSGILDGSEIPYPVALIAEKPTPFAGNSARNAMCKIAAAYGVDSYPTMILIDREGNIAGEFRDTPEDLTLLKELLGIHGGLDDSDH